MRVAWLLVLAACFHAHGTVKDAQSATYKMTGAAMMSLAEDVTKKTYKLGEVDDKKLVFETQKQPLTEKGKPYELQLIVEVVEIAGGDCSVTVKAKTFAAGKELDAEDPDVPELVHTRANDLSIAIYDRAKAFAYSH